MASTVARAYKGGLGAEPPAGSRDRAPGQGVRRRSPPEAEAFLAFGRSMEAGTLETQRHQIFMLSLQKIMGGHETGGGEAKLGAVPLGPGLKPPLGRAYYLLRNASAKSCSNNSSFIQQRYLSVGLISCSELIDDSLPAAIERD